jgi:hypothetical protein
MRDKILQILKNPLLNLWINIVMMIIQFGMSLIQFTEGDTVAGTTFAFSGLSCISAVTYWILIWWAAKKS